MELNLYGIKLPSSEWRPSPIGLARNPINEWHGIIATWEKTNRTVHAPRKYREKMCVEEGYVHLPTEIDAYENFFLPFYELIAEKSRENYLNQGFHGALGMTNKHIKKLPDGFTVDFDGFITPPYSFEGENVEAHPVAWNVSSGLHGKGNCIRMIWDSAEEYLEKTIAAKGRNIKG